MAQEPEGQRIYTEKETSAILQRASELQAREDGAPHTRGMSLAQLQQAASELGIKPHLISQAASDLASNNARATNSFWGTPTSTHLESVVAHRISEDNWPTVLNNLRRASGRVGDSITVGKSFEWKSTSPDTCHVSVTPEGENSRVTVASHYGEWAMVYYMLPLIPAFLTAIGVISSTSFSAPVDMAVFLGIFAAALGLGHRGFRALTERRRKTAQALMTVLETAIEPTQTTRQATESETQSTTPYQTQIQTADHSAKPEVQVIRRT